MTIVTLTGVNQPFTARWLGEVVAPASKRKLQVVGSVFIAPDETRGVKVTFKPKASRAYQSRFQFSSGGTGSVVTVAVSGRGCLTNPTE